MHGFVGWTGYTEWPLLLSTKWSDFEYNSCQLRGPHNEEKHDQNLRLVAKVQQRQNETVLCEKVT